MAPPSWIEIDLRRVAANLQALRRLLYPSTDREPARQRPAAPTRFCAVVKADAYGMGAATLARHLLEAGADMLAVFSMDQAAQLAPVAGAAPILVLGPVDDLELGEDLRHAVVNDRLQLTLHSLRQLETVGAIGHAFGHPVPVHLHLDTGMSRGGMDRRAFERALRIIPDLPTVRLAGVSTHMAASDEQPELTEWQYRQLIHALHANRGRLPADLIVHAANTFTTLRNRRYHLGMVRAGLGLHGFGPELLAPGPVLADTPVLRPAIRWCSRIVHLRRFPRDAGVGYNHTCHLRRDSLLGIVPVGYGDGYPTQLGNRAHVRLPALSTRRGTHACAPVVGKVNMDQIVIDLTDLPQAELGMTVEIYASDATAPCAVPRLAELAGTHCYDMLTRVCPRVPRRLVGAEQPERRSAVRVVVDPDALRQGLSLRRAPVT